MLPGDGFLVIDEEGHEALEPGHWIEGGRWERFGLYNSYVVERADGRVLRMPAHAGELVPGGTEELVEALHRLADPEAPLAPMTLELDPTYRCASRDCGGACFSAAYRALAPTAGIPPRLLREIIGEFADWGGRIVRFDGGGDPLLHTAVRSGDAVEHAAERGLLSTILTSGDLLPSADLDRLAASGTYVRVSLNASTDATRMRFHGNAIPLARVLGAVENLVRRQHALGVGVPAGATYLLSHDNYWEVLQAARLARDVGIAHFAARRILGPDHLRPPFSPGQIEELDGLLAEVRLMHGPDFRVAVPWRSPVEADLNPTAGDFTASRCWQSTLKAVVEPEPEAGGARTQLCGRYRGGGIGQQMSLPAVAVTPRDGQWVRSWRDSFRNYPIPRSELPRTCVSCIDRGFILMVERLWSFASGQAFSIRHFASKRPGEVREWASMANVQANNAPKWAWGNRPESLGACEDHEPSLPCVRGCVSVAAADPQKKRRLGP